MLECLNRASRKILKYTAIFPITDFGNDKPSKLEQNTRASINMKATGLRPLLFFFLQTVYNDKGKLRIGDDMEESQCLECFLICGF